TPHLRCYLENEVDRCRITEIAMTTPPSPIRVNAEGSGTDANSTRKPVGLTGEKPVLVRANSRVLIPATKNSDGRVNEVNVLTSAARVLSPVLWPLIKMSVPRSSVSQRPLIITELGSEPVMVKMVE